MKTNSDPHPGNLLIQVRDDGSVVPVLLDYGMCRELPDDKRIAFAKMICSASSMDFGSLLNSFDDMGLKLKRMDPAEDMKNIRFILRDTAPGAEMRKQFKKFREDVWQKRQQLPKSKRNPVEAYPAELLFFFRVTLLLRGLCAVLGVRVKYSSLLAPYAKLALLRHHPKQTHAVDAVPLRAYPSGAALNPRVQDAVLACLRKLHAQGLATGVQVAVYHKGELVVDAASGTMGETDPRAVHTNSLFNVFSVTKGIITTAVHLLVERGQLKYTDKIAQHWPAFAAHGKQDATVEMLLKHQTGLHRVPGMDVSFGELCSWRGMLKRLEESTPETTPGLVTRYHILSYGWLVGGLIQAVTGAHLRDFCRMEFALPLHIEVCMTDVESCLVADDC